MGPLWTEMLSIQSQWFIYICRSPQVKELSYEMEGNIRSSSTEPQVDRRPGFPRGSLTARLSLPQCNAAFSTISSTFTWEDQSPVSQRVSQ
jgi:hypothetical protein